MKKTFKKIIVSIITWQAKRVLARYSPKVIAITGSVGKTSTKDAIFTVMKTFKTVRKSEKSFNSEIGIPLTILGISNGWDSPTMWIENIFRGFVLIFGKKQEYPEWLVLEVGAGKPGDIKNVAPWIAPDMVVVTRFPDVPVHVEFFPTVEDIVEEKSALAYALKKDGVLILNHDDPKVYALCHKTKSRAVSYGMHEHATYRATYWAYSYVKENNLDIAHGIHFKLEYKGNTFPVRLPHIVGMHYVGSALAALACAHEAGCEILPSIEALASYVTPPGRLARIAGINHSVIIDDTYNASPVAMDAALDVLSEMKGMRKIAVLGDMLELGKYTEEAHRKAGEKAKEIADMIITVGPRARFIADGALEKGFPKKELYQFDSSDTTAKFLQGVVEKGDIVLLKGSQGVRLERAVKAIMAEPDQASKLLCRQEKEWGKR